MATSASASSAAEARAALRALLRCVDRHLTGVAGNTQWRDHVRAEFRRPLLRAAGGGGATSSSGSSGSSIDNDDDAVVVEAEAERARRIRLARDYVLLADNIAHHRQLLASYNLGVDPDERNKRMVEATARRVGFALPHEEKPPPRPRRTREEGKKDGGDGSESDG